MVVYSMMHTLRSSRTRASSLVVISLPVTSAWCTMRFLLCAPSRV